MSKIAIVGCDASGKTVLVSALTDYYKSGQRPGQICSLISADTLTRRYTDKLHHTMRIQHKWPAATSTSRAEGLQKLKWTMVKDGKPFTDIEMLDYGGENFRYAFRDDGTTRNAAVVEELVDYISEADFIVITVGIDNMIRTLTPDVYRQIENGNEAYDRDSEAQWITRGLLQLVKGKVEATPSGVVVALTQADKYRAKLTEYGGAKGLFAKCWSDIDVLYPNLQVVACASVDKLTAGGFPADDYKTDGVLVVMKEFVRYIYGDCDVIKLKIQQEVARLKNMNNINEPSDFSRCVSQYEKKLRDFYDITAIVQEIYKDDLQKWEEFLALCKRFVKTLEEIERRPIVSQIDSEYWKSQLVLFPELAGTIKGVIHYYQRRREQAQSEAQARLLAEQEREREAKRAEEERRRQLRIAEENARLAELRKQEEDVKCAVDKREEEDVLAKNEKQGKRNTVFILLFVFSSIVCLVVVNMWRGQSHELDEARQAQSRAEEAAAANAHALVKARQAQSRAEEAAAANAHALVKARQAQSRAEKAGTDNARALDEAHQAQSRAEEAAAANARALEEARQKLSKLPLRMRAELGDADAKRELVRQFESSANKGDGNAMYQLGVWYYGGKMGLKRSKEKAYEWFLKAKKNGCSFDGSETGVDAWIRATEPIKESPQKISSPRKYWNLIDEL